MMVAVDLSILTTCLPQLAKIFRTDASVIGWLNITYFIMTQSLMLTIAKVGDAKGRKNVFVTGLGLYTIGLLLASLSQSIGQLIAARVLQGAAGATVTALGMAITIATFETEERGKAIGVLLGCTSIGLVAGPMIGGLIFDLLGWRAVFYTRIPFVVVSLISAWIIIIEPRIPREHFKFDSLGAFALFGWLSSLLLFLSFANKWGITSPGSLLPAATTVGFFIVFVRTELKAAQPIVELGMFRKRLFSSAVIASMASTIGSSSAIFLVPFFLIQGLGLSATAVGTHMALLAAPSLVLSPVSGRLSDRIGSRILSTAGVVTVCLGLTWFISLGPGATFVGIAVGMVILGSGIAIFHPPNNNALVGAVPKEMLGVASAIGMTSRHVGSSIALAISGALYSANELQYLVSLRAKGLDPVALKRMATALSFRDTLIVALIIACFGIFASLFRGSGEVKGP
jgi:EmrB/QacA subfamily drug resistance transporter